jgi:DNA-binding response OmpR family regulator
LQYHIAAVDDEEDILDALQIVFKKEGFNFKGFDSAKGLLNYAAKNSPDLFILDIMLPDMNGYDICRALRQDKRFAHTPVIFLSAKSEEFDKVLGLELGADDYITKPFSPKELTARVRAVLRRSGRKEVLPENAYPLKIDKDALEVFVSGKKISLTLTEFKILEMLFNKKGKVFSREEILDYVWGEGKFITDRVVDVHIKNLREKLGKAGALIKNVRGAGYKLEA